ncbi:MAG: hypothetical protein ABUJ92_00580 [Desulfobacterales bacterium]
MNNSNADGMIFAIAFVLGCIAGSLVFGGLASYNQKTSMRSHAIENQCASYDMKTGDFKWNNEMEE